MGVARPCLCRATLDVRWAYLLVSFLQAGQCGEGGTLSLYFSNCDGLPVRGLLLPQPSGRDALV